MSGRNSSFSPLFNMEGDIKDVARWGELLRVLGATDIGIDAGVLWVIAKPIQELSERLEANWAKAFNSAGGES